MSLITHNPIFTLLPLGTLYQVPVTIINQKHITPSGFQLQYLTNESNYTSLTAPSLENIEYSYPKNRTIITSYIEGNVQNVSNTNNLNYIHSLSTYLKINPILPSANESTFNISWSNNTNHPLYNQPDAQIEDPNGLHGITLFGISGSIQANVLAYAANDPRISSILVSISANEINPSQGIYNYANVTQQIITYIAIGKKIILTIASVGYDYPTNDTPR